MSSPHGALETRNVGAQALERRVYGNCQAITIKTLLLPLQSLTTMTKQKLSAFVLSAGLFFVVCQKSSSVEVEYIRFLISFTISFRSFQPTSFFIFRVWAKYDRTSDDPECKREQMMKISWTILLSPLILQTYEIKISYRQAFPTMCRY